MDKQKSYLDNGFNEYLTRRDNVDDQIKVNKAIEEQTIQQLNLILTEIKHIWSEIYEVVNSRGVTKDVKIRLLNDYKEQLTEAINRKHTVGNKVDQREVGLAIAKIIRLEEGLSDQPNAEGSDISSSKWGRSRTPALELFYSGNLLQIRGAVIKNPITLVHVQSKGSGLLLKPIFKLSKGNPDSFRKLTKKGLLNKDEFNNQELSSQIEAICQKPSKLGKYFNGLRLKRPIKDLFFHKANSDMRYQFRSVVTIEVWQDLPLQKREEIVKYLSNLALLNK